MVAIEDHHATIKICSHNGVMWSVKHLSVLPLPLLEFLGLLFSITVQDFAVHLHGTVRIFQHFIGTTTADAEQRPVWPEFEPPIMQLQKSSIGRGKVEFQTFFRRPDL